LIQKTGGHRKEFQLKRTNDVSEKKGKKEGISQRGKCRQGKRVKSCCTDRGKSLHKNFGRKTQSKEGFKKVGGQ